MKSFFKVRVHLLNVMLATCHLFKHLPYMEMRTKSIELKIFVDYVMLPIFFIIYIRLIVKF